MVAVVSETLRRDRRMTPEERKLYRDGIRDGMEITLRLIVGDDSTDGEPYRGWKPKQLRKWARAALGRIEADKEDLT